MCRRESDGRRSEVWLQLKLNKTMGLQQIVIGARGAFEKKVLGRVVELLGKSGLEVLHASACHEGTHHFEVGNRENLVAAGLLKTEKLGETPPVTLEVLNEKLDRVLANVALPPPHPVPPAPPAVEPGSLKYTEVAIDGPGPDDPGPPGTAGTDGQPAAATGDKIPKSGQAKPKAA